MKTKTCLVVALLAGGSAAAHAERPPDCAPATPAPARTHAERIEANASGQKESHHESPARMMESKLPLPDYAIADPGALRAPGFERHDVRALAVPEFAVPEAVAGIDAAPHRGEVLAGHAPLPLPAFALPQMLAQTEAEALADAAGLSMPELAMPEENQLAAADTPGIDGWQPVDGDSLSAMRGGFTIPGGLVVSLGLERLVSINGEVVTRTSFALPAGGAPGDVAAAARDALGGGLIQNGPGNISLATMAPEALGATIIQNTLNDQTIRSQTIINASVNSATLMQSLNFSDSLGQAIRNAIGSH